LKLRLELPTQASKEGRKQLTHKGAEPN